jgi:UPF0042 nucleotide-binding protein
MSDQETYDDHDGAHHNINKTSSSSPHSETMKRRIVFVSGLSGAGISSALKNLEDFGFEVFDNIPLSLIQTLIDDEGAAKGDIAFAIDSRTRDFAPLEIINFYDRLKHKNDIQAHLCFLKCSDDTIYQRYSETRRPHPLAKERPIGEGIELERKWLAPLMQHASISIDTSELSAHDLKKLLGSSFQTADNTQKIYVSVMSFGFKNGLPREADMVLDVRFLRNPHWDRKLRPMTGREALVQEYIKADEGFEGFATHVESLLKDILPRYNSEGKSYFTLAVGCTGGKHRSVFLSERWAEYIQDLGFAVTLRHRDLK